MQPLTALKIAVLAPMASTRVRTATAANAGARRRWRKASRTSCRSSARYSARRTLRSCSRPSFRQRAPTSARSPKRRRASARASGSLRPCAISSRVTISRWKSSSSSTWSATLRRQNIGSARQQDGGHCLDELGEAPGLGGELFPALGRELVEARLAAQLGDPPLGLDPPLPLHPVEGGVERALLDLDRLAAGVAEPAADGVPVSGTPAQGLEDEGVEGAVEAVFALGGHGGTPRCLCLGQTAGATPRCQGIASEPSFIALLCDAYT